MALPAQPLPVSTETQTITIHTTIPNGTPLQLEIPAPAGAPAPLFATITLPPAPPGTPVPITQTVSLVVLTDAVFVVKDPLGGEVESFTLHQTLVNAPVSTVVKMNPAPIGSIPLSNDDSTATLVLASAPPMGFVGSGSTTLDATVGGFHSSSPAKASSTFGGLFNSTAAHPTLVHPTAVPSPSSTPNTTNDKMSAPSMTPLRKGEIVLYVLLGLVAVGIAALIVWRLRKCRKAESTWRENEHEKRVTEQQRRADETAWNAKVVKEGVELTAEQFRERVQAALTELEGYQHGNRLRAKASKERVANGEAGGLDDC
jgi:hypothetical protein